ncbi:MAG: inositol 2-dehydrogenase [Clostridiaceae bacterium]|nr:inositol 2-dehydrogenase [Clostridiaceae bacterium]
MKKYKIGVIGTGRIGKLHIENLMRYIPEAEVYAAADVMIEHSKEWLEENNIEHVFSDYKDLLALEEIDAVVISTPTDTHAEISIAAAEAGKHVFCEKPVDLTVERVKDVIAAVKKADVVFQVGFNRRFDHNFRRVREHVVDGNIGDVHMVLVTSRDPAPPPVSYIESSGGLFLDMMIHDFDMVRYQSGAEVVAVTAHGANLVDPEIGEAGDIDTAIVTLELSNGALAMINNSRQAVYGYDQRVEVFGSKGQATAYNDQPNNVELYTEEDISTDKIPYFFLDRYTNAFINQFEDFIKALKGEIEVPVNDVDGLRAIEIALACNESLKTGERVELVYDEL